MKTKKPYGAVLGENLIFQGEKKKNQEWMLLARGAAFRTTMRTDESS